MLVRVRKGIQLLKFCQYYGFIIVLTMHGGGTPQGTSQVISVFAYIRKKALDPNLESGFQHGMWDLCRERVVKYLRL